ncbi:hypothetical protein HZH66_001057 [Vespula vulgaris]|uniref:Uncharacterized protein n=1 Tax=Vespula vulgaris TaxID=7454 RepID=A0A834KSC5_VESVU|nr:hypothetical protein HZH66_001057 [Vespula vulgaris]
MTRLTSPRPQEKRSELGDSKELLIKNAFETICDPTQGRYGKSLRIGATRKIRELRKFWPTGFAAGPRPYQTFRISPAEKPYDTKVSSNRPLRFHTRQLQLTSWSTVACSRLLPQQVVEIVVAPTRGGALLSITLFSLSDTRPPVGGTINLHLSVLPQNTVPEGVSLPSR